jgi:hypothetical protein
VLRVVARNVRSTHMPCLRDTEGWINEPYTFKLSITVAENILFSGSVGKNSAVKAQEDLSDALELCWTSWRSILTSGISSLIWTHVYPDIWSTKLPSMGVPGIIETGLTGAAA